MKPDNRILDPETSERNRAARSVFIGAFLPALMALVLLSVVNPAAAANGPATTFETSETSEEEDKQETVEVTYDEAELEMAGLINDYRAEKGLDPLLVSDTASLAAKRHSEDMDRYGFMDHDSQESAYFDHGASFDERLAESSYDYNTALAENIAAGAGVEETFEGWKGSPYHEKNMLDPEMEVIGVGLSTSGDTEGSQGSESSESSGEGEYGAYWTTDFGAHTDRTATEPSKIQAEPDPEDNATNDQYGQESKPGTEDKDSPDDEIGSTAEEDGPSGDSGESGESGDESGDGEQGITEEQYSTGDEDPAGEGSSNESSSSDEEGEPGERGERVTDESTTEQSSTEQPSSEQDNEDSPAESGGARDCDTLDGFDRSPFDPDFGSELSRLIRAKVDCKLDESGIGGEEAEAGQDGAVAGGGEDTTGQKPDAAPSTSGNGDGDPNVGPATDDSTGEPSPEPGDEPSDEPDEATTAVLGPASTGSASPSGEGRED